MKIERVIMTPARAAGILLSNPKNRTVTKTAVEKIRQAILRGEWVEDANPIKVAQDGTLLDGQHRLMAIAASNLSVPVLLATDVEEGARLVVDTGRPRSFAHYLQIRGIPQQNRIAAATGALFQYVPGRGLPSGGSDIAPTHLQLLAILEKREDDIVEAVRAAERVREHVRGSTKVWSLAYLILSEVDKEDASHFFEQAASGNPSVQPIGTLVRMLNEPRHETWLKHSGKMACQRLLALIIKAWNAYRDGREVGLLSYRPGGASAESFPVPH